MLLCKNVIVNGRRTSMRLDQETWDALNDICANDKITIHDLCSRIDDARPKNAGLSSSVRRFVLNYFRAALKKAEQNFPATRNEFNAGVILKTLID